MPATNGDDEIYGTSDAEVIHGLAGNDLISGYAGDDQLYGDEGDDRITLGGNGMLAGIYAPVFAGTVLGDGGTGNDTLTVFTNASNVTALGGEGNDLVRVRGLGAVNVNLGTGDDTVEAELIGGLTVTMGAGADVFKLVSSGFSQDGGPYFAPGFQITLTDYKPSEDRLDLNLGALLTGWSVDVNPFTAGYLRLVQSGADTILQVDRDGSAGSASSFATLMRLQNLQASAITQIDRYGVDGGGPITNGTAGDDVINGSGRLNGLGGNDTIRGYSGDDVLHGNDGNDSLNGGGGSDQLFGDAGNDTLAVGLDGYRYFHTVVMDGGADDDFLFFGNSQFPNTDITAGNAHSARATITGGAGNDIAVLWGSGKATVDMGAGNDFVQVGGSDFYTGVIPESHSIKLGTGADTLLLVHDNSTAVHVVTDFNPSEDVVRLSETSFFRSVFPIQVTNAFRDGYLRLVASGGDTVLQFDIDGGANSWADVIRFRNVAPSAFTEIGGYRVDGTGTVDLTLTPTSSYSYVAAVTPIYAGLHGGAGNDVITGSAGSDGLAGEGGNDRLYGLAGDDRLEGGFGDNLLDGGEGNDQLVGGGAHDRLLGGAGNDRLSYSPLVPYGVTSDTAYLDGGDGDDMLSVSSTFATGTLIGGAGNDTIQVDGFGTDVVDAGDGNDIVSMSNPLSTITLGAGADTLTLLSYQTTPPSQLAIVTDFRPGVDTLVFNRTDYLTGYSSGNPFAQGYLWLSQDGADVVLRRDPNGGGDTYYDMVRFQNTSLSAFTAADFSGFDFTVAPVIAPIRGTTGNDRLVGSSGPNTFIGDAGADQILGDAGADTIIYADSASGVTIDLAAGTGLGGDAQGDTLSAIENVVGSRFDDVLLGSLGANALSGGAGNDRLTGGVGDDALDGGAGTDTAVFGGVYRQSTVTARSVVGPDGSDTLTSVEHASFKDGELSLDENDNWAQVVRLYDTALQRAPDAAGLDFYAHSLDAGTRTLFAVAQDFLYSAEFQQATGSLNNQQFVQYLYETALGRAADPGGLSYWTGQLDNGLLRSTMLVNFSETAEHRAQTADLLAGGYFTTDANYQNMALIYDTALGRLPDAAGLVYWGEALKTGAQTLQSAAAGFAASAEFSGNTAGLTNAQLVDYMYQNTLGRAADPGGSAYWVGRLEAGLPKSELLLDFALSAEHRAQQAAYIDHGIVLA